MSESLYTDEAIDNLRKEVATLREQVFHVRSRKDVASKAAGVISENYGIEGLTGSSAPPSQSVLAGLIGLRKGDIVTNIIVAVIGGGTGAAPTLIKLGLAGPDGKMVALTANDAGNARWTTNNSFAVVPLTTPYVAAETGGYQPTFLKNGVFATSDVTLGKSQLVNATISVGIGGGVPRISVYGSTATDLPAVGAALVRSAGSATAYWFGVS